jgi:hypothetical protein
MVADDNGKGAVQRQGQLHKILKNLLFPEYVCMVFASAKIIPEIMVKIRQCSLTYSMYFLLYF